MEVQCGWCGQHVAFKDGPDVVADDSICVVCGLEHFPDQFAELGYVQKDDSGLPGLPIVVILVASLVSTGGLLYLADRLLWG